MIWDFHVQARLGDVVWLAIFLRGAARLHPQVPFTIFCDEHYGDAVMGLVADVPNIHIRKFEDRPPHSINAWIATMEPKEGDGYRIEMPATIFHGDWVKAQMDWSKQLAERAGIENPLQDRRDCVLDSELIRTTANKFSHFDFMVVNSLPLSYQMPKHCQKAMDRIIDRLSARWEVRWTNKRDGDHENLYTLTQIGAMSLRCWRILGVANGPMWPTFNVFNRSTLKKRWLLCGTAFVDYGVKDPHFESVEELEAELEREGFI